MCLSFRPTPHDFLCGASQQESRNALSHDVWTWGEAVPQQAQSRGRGRSVVESVEDPSWCQKQNEETELIS